MGDLTAYADALGIKASPPSRPASAPGQSWQVDPSVQRTRDVAAAGILRSEVANAPDPQTAADTQKTLARLQTTGSPTGVPVNNPAPQGSDMSAYAAALGITPAKPAAPVAQAAQPAAQAAQPQQEYSDIPVPRQSPPTTVAEEPSWWQKAKGAASAVTSLTTGAVGGLVAGAANVATLPGDLANNRPHEPLSAAMQRGSAALTYTPEDAGSREVAGDILNSKIVQSLPAISPVTGEVAALGPMARAYAGDAARTSMGAMQDAFRGKQAAGARVEPTMGAPAAAAPAAAVTPGGAPTLAQATPELQQAFAAAKDKGAPIDSVIAARHIEADTLPVPVKLTKGQATMDPTLISDEMNGRGKGKGASVPPDFYKQQGQALSQNMDAIRATAAPDVPTTANLVDHGQALIDSYKQMDAPVKADISAKYKALSDANGGNLPLNGQDFVTAADAALSKQMKGRYVPAAVAGDLEQFRSGGPMTFEQFENLRTNLAAEARKADRAGDGNAAGAVNIVRSTLEALPMTDETAAIKPLADAARQAAAARFAAIKSDPAYKAAIGDSVGVGEPSPLADKFFNSYVTKGARANVALMREHLGDDSLAGQTIAAGTLDQLRDQFKANPEAGTFSQDGLNKGLKAIAPKIDSLLDPVAAQQVQAVGNVAKVAQTQPRGSYVNNSNSATSYLAEKAKDVAEHGVNIMSGGIPTGSIGRAIGGRILDARGARKATNDALAPAAGLTRLSDFPK